MFSNLAGWDLFVAAVVVVVVLVVIALVTRRPSNTNAQSEGLLRVWFPSDL